MRSASDAHRSLSLDFGPCSYDEGTTLSYSSPSCYPFDDYLDARSTYSILRFHDSMLHTKFKKIVPVSCAYMGQNSYPYLTLGETRREQNGVTGSPG